MPHNSDIQEAPMAHAAVHTELNTTDVAAAKKFYGQLFDWQVEDLPMARSAPPAAK